MGCMSHDAVVVVTADFREGGLPDMDGFRATLPPKMAQLVIGPIITNPNAYVVYAFLPDGSKEGWPDSDTADEARERFKDLFRFHYEDGSTPDNWVHVRFGGDRHPELAPEIVEAHEDADPPTSPRPEPAA